MMRYILILLSSLLSFSGFVLADSSSQTSGYVTKSVPLSSLGVDDALQQINTYFCHQGADKITNRLLLSLYPGEHKDICMAIGNKSSGDIAVSFNLVTFGKTQQGDNNCDSTLSGNSFSDNFLDSNGAISLVVSGSATTVASLPISVLDTLSGGYTGCLVYTLTNHIKNKDSMFDVVMFKSNLVHIDVEQRTFFQDILHWCLAHQTIILSVVVILCFSLFFVLQVSSKKSTKKKH